MKIERIDLFNTRRLKDDVVPVIDAEEALKQALNISSKKSYIPVHPFEKCA